MNRLSDRDYQDLMNSPDVQSALEQKAELIRDLSKKGTKKLTGATADSIVMVDALRDDGVRVRRVGWDLDVDENGPFYEFGTEDTPPHPILRAAARAAGRR